MAPPSQVQSPPRGVKPVQICDIDVENDSIVCNHEALETIERNLQLAGVESISIISIMGLYRTGKSFFLDLLMRYLNFLGNSRRNQECEVSVQRKFGDSNTHPEWLRYNGAGKSERITEGRIDDSGFPWRAGAQKLTRGIWMLSAPYVIQTPKGLRGILLMDTQGAWDSEMTKDLSACVFALTAILSSKLVYNVRNSLNSQNIENLDYFTTVAKVVLPIEDVGKMGELQVLIRDWEHYEDGSSLEECDEEVFQHRNEFLSKEHAKNGANGEAIDRLENLFSQIKVSALPHPGKSIVQKTWNGDIKDIDCDFVCFLGRLLNDLISDIELSPGIAPMSEPLTGENFATLIASTIEAFRTTATEAINLRDAFVTLRVLRSRNVVDSIIDNRIREFRRSHLMDPSTLEGKLRSFKAEMVKMYREQLAPLQLEKEDDMVKELEEKLTDLVEEAATNNSSKFFNATVKLIAAPMILVPAGLTLISLPHIMLYFALAGGGLAHLRARSKDWRLWTVNAISSVALDVENFGRERLNDGRSIMVVANRCFVSPQQVTAQTVAQATQMRQMQRLMPM